MNTPENAKSEVKWQEQATYAMHEAARTSLSYKENPNLLKEKILDLIHFSKVDLPTSGAVLISAFTDLLIYNVDSEHWDAVFDSFYEVGKKDLLEKKNVR